MTTESSEILLKIIIHYCIDQWSAMPARYCWEYYWMGCRKQDSKWSDWL